MAKGQITGTYEESTNMAYIRFRSDKRVYYTHQLADDVLLDVDEAGKPIGIEIFSPRPSIVKKINANNQDA